MNSLFPLNFSVSHKLHKDPDWWSHLWAFLWNFPQSRSSGMLTQTHFFFTLLKEETCFENFSFDDQLSECIISSRITQDTNLTARFCSSIIKLKAPKLFQELEKHPFPSLHKKGFAFYPCISTSPLRVSSRTHLYFLVNLFVWKLCKFLSRMVSYRKTKAFVHDSEYELSITYLFS